MIGDEDAFAELDFEPADFFLEFLDGDRIDAAEWFIQENQFGIGDERAGDSSFRRSPPLRVSAR